MVADGRLYQRFSVAVVGAAISRPEPPAFVGSPPGSLPGKRAAISRPYGGIALRARGSALRRYLDDYTPSNSFLQGREKCAIIGNDIEMAMTELSTTRTQPKRGRGWWNRLLWVRGLPSRAAA